MNPVVTVQCGFPYGTPSKHQPFRFAAHMLLLYLNTSHCEHKCWFKRLFYMYCKYNLTIYNYVYWRINGLCACIPINYIFFLILYTQAQFLLDE